MVRIRRTVSFRNYSTVINYSSSFASHFAKPYSNPIVMSPCTRAVKWTSTSRSSEMEIFKLLSFCFGLPSLSRSAPDMNMVRIWSGVRPLSSSSDSLAASCNCLRRPSGVVAGSLRSSVLGIVSKVDRGRGQCERGVLHCGTAIVAVPWSPSAYLAIVLDLRGFRGESWNGSGHFSGGRLSASCSLIWLPEMRAMRR